MDMSGDHRAAQAELIKALANPARLAVLHELQRGERTATQLVRSCGLSKANLSQHINLLKREGLVRCVKHGTFCYYSLSDRRLTRVLDLLDKLMRTRRRR